MSLFKVEVKGEKALVVKFNRRARNISNTRGANLAAAVQIKSWTIKNIDHGGNDHDSATLKWPPLKPSTIAARRRGPGTGSVKPLQDTGRLKGAFETFATHRFGKVENKVKYSVVHEDGTSKVPKRKMFPGPKQASKIVFPVYDKFVNKAIK